MAPIIGGWLADSICGRFNAIYGSLLVYVVGALLLPVTACNFQKIFGIHYLLSLVRFMLCTLRYFCESMSQHVQLFLGFSVQFIGKSLIAEITVNSLYLVGMHNFIQNYNTFTV